MFASLFISSWFQIWFHQIILLWNLLWSLLIIHIFVSVDFHGSKYNTLYLMFWCLLCFDNSRPKRKFRHDMPLNYFQCCSDLWSFYSWALENHWRGAIKNHSVLGGVYILCCCFLNYLAGSSLVFVTAVPSSAAKHSIKR